MVTNTASPTGKDQATISSEIATTRRRTKLKPRPGTNDEQGALKKATPALWGVWGLGPHGKAEE